MNLPLAGTVTVVTGGGRGIGRSIAIRFAQAGGIVVLAARTKVELSSATKSIVEAGGDASYILANVSSPKDCLRVVEETLSRKGKITNLVNNAGIAVRTPVHEMSDELWKEVLFTNLFGPFYLTRAVAEAMISNREGCIVNISSRAAYRGTRDHAAYCASKSGLIGLTRASAEDFKPFGIRVNAVCPDGVDTEMIRKTYPSADFSSLMSPQQVAEAVMFLCLPQSSGITGATIDVFGMREGHG